MNTFALISGMAGGVGLFLLGMWMMTEGLKLAAGPQLRTMLTRATRSRGRGLAAGVVVTALVQSSSAVTVATIGFVNAGLLNLSQALWVLFGANVGTTMTGWLVALVGLKFKIEALALPMVGLGMLLRMGDDGSRRGALGMALAGFGVLFIGIDTLQATFTDLATTVRLPEGTAPMDTLVQVLIGVLLTVLMQSSSAALAIVLTAAQGGMLTLYGASAVVIGSNIGTTVTALIAAIGATPNARRAGAAHVLFNALTGIAALLMLPWLVVTMGWLANLLGLGRSMAVELALFHTTFNLMGVVLMWPLTARLTTFLQKRFRTQEEDEARPRYLDTNVLAVPTLAMDALERELRRLGVLALRMVAGAIAQPPAPTLTRDRNTADLLQTAIAEFIVQINRKGMLQTSARRLPELLRVARYYEVAAENAMQAAVRTVASTVLQMEALSDFYRQTQTLLAAIDPQVNLPHNDVGAAARAPANATAVVAPAASTVVSETHTAAAVDIDTALQSFEAAYQVAKAALLEAGAEGRFAAADIDNALQSTSGIRRAMQQAAKATQRLNAAWRGGPDTQV